MKRLFFLGTLLLCTGFIVARVPFRKPEMKDIMKKVVD